MIVKIRISNDDPFSRVPKEILEDRRISWRAKGIIAYLLGKPNDWTVQTGDIIARSTEGRDAVRKAFRELKNAGYARLEVIRDSNGQVVGKQWTVSDVSDLDRETKKPSFGHEPTDGKTDDRSIGRSNKKEGRTKKEEEPSLLAPLWRDRIGAILGRKPSTKWTTEEDKAFAAIMPVDDDELAMVERFYKSERKKKDSYCRTNVLRLLRHWPGEVDKARIWCERHPVRSRVVRFTTDGTPPTEKSPELTPEELEADRRFREDFERHRGRKLYEAGATQ